MSNDDEPLMGMMPPEAVAQIDRQQGQYYERIDQLLGKYQALCERHGTAMAQAVMAADAYNGTTLASIPQLINTLVFTLARLAELQPRKAE